MFNVQKGNTRGPKRDKGSKSKPKGKGKSG